jgi:hypothetical protein
MEIFCDNSKPYTHLHLIGQEQFYCLGFLKNPAAPIAGFSLRSNRRRDWAKEDVLQRSQYVIDVL